MKDQTFGSAENTIYYVYMDMKDQTYSIALSLVSSVLVFLVDPIGLTLCEVKS
jgi:hypothetical protein